MIKSRKKRKKNIKKGKDMHKNTQKYTYLTIRQLAEKYPFSTLYTWRNRVYRDEKFRDACVRYLGPTVLVDEEKMLEFIQKSKSK